VMAAPEEAYPVSAVQQKRQYPHTPYSTHTAHSLMPVEMRRSL